VLLRKFEAFPARGAKRGVCEEEKREQIGSRGRLLHLRHPRSLRGVYNAAGAKKTYNNKVVSTLQNKDKAQLYFNSGGLERHLQPRPTEEEEQL